MKTLLINNKKNEAGGGRGTSIFFTWRSALFCELKTANFGKNNLFLYLSFHSFTPPALQTSLRSAGIFCRLQVAGCRLKFDYNGKTAGTKKKGKAIDLP